MWRIYGARGRLNLQKYQLRGCNSPFFSAILPGSTVDVCVAFALATPWFCWYSSKVGKPSVLEARKGDFNDNYNEPAKQHGLLALEYL